MRRLTRLVLCLFLTSCLGGLRSAGAAVDPASRCIDAKLGAVAKHARSLLKCHAKAVRKGAALDASCVAKADQKLDKLIAKADARGGCPTQADAGYLRLLSERLVGRALAGVAPNSNDGSICTAKKLGAGGVRVLKAAKAHGKNVKSPDPAKLVASVAKLGEVFDKKFVAAEKKADCQTTGDAVFAAARFDSGLDAIYAAVGLVPFETIDVPSGAQAAETPGTAGVDPSDYPKLVTQFGGTTFDLNQATYTRFRYAGAGQPDAILITVPGFEGGAMGFKMMAENLVTRSLEQGFATELWAFDRRGNQIEDREGVRIAAEEQDELIALDWYFGDDLGLPLSPELVAGPNRRAIIHGEQAETAFMANWTELVFSRDIDAVVEQALSVAKNGNVFLGGHSAGTGFVARYAATDFDLTGGGPAEPGYEKLRGLALFEGGGGSTGDPLTEDELDRIEDRADGGLFTAVRDNAPRCVDGTACTVATEGVDCAGKGNETCTEPTFAYAVIPGLLNPAIFAGSEPGAVQGIDDPDAGQLVLQVDQGAPGNNAIDVVPELAALAILPQATAEGALGTFLDDDGFIAAFASFVATSVGAPGPVVGGLTTWQDISEGPFAAGVLPDNGPPPTDPPFPVWGTEVEVTRLDRIGLTFVTPGSNFADWYYPSSGLGTTGSLGLDSSQLSVGRGRRDIENLTQAANIDIPVIGFGGTNGLTEVPGVFTGFGESIGTCAAPSCDGTARVVDAATPSVAFPTLGGVDGGFEVHLSEGYAHVDIISAEDDSTNQVIGPLIDFLQRNAQ